MKLEWNVLYYNFNSDKIEKLNIFNSNFINELDEATINDRESLKKYIISSDPEFEDFFGKKAYFALFSVGALSYGRGRRAFGRR